MPTWQSETNIESTKLYPKSTCEAFRHAFPVSLLEGSSGVMDQRYPKGLQEGYDAPC